MAPVPPDWNKMYFYDKYISGHMIFFFEHTACYSLKGGILDQVEKVLL